METLQSELDKSYAIVDSWFDALAEKVVAEPLNRSALRIVLEDTGANFDQDPETLERFNTGHYSFNVRQKALKLIWGDNYSKFTDFCESFTDQKGVIFKKTGHQTKFVGLRQFFTELTAFAGTTEENYSQSDFMTRITAQVVNGKLREYGVTDKNHRMEIVVPGYNMITFAFHDDPEDIRIGELPFAPVSVPPDFPQKAWEEIKSWKK